jgi:hypothetical protein
VVKADPVIDDPFCLETVGDFVQKDSLLFQRPPQPLDEDVVEITQHVDPIFTCELTALIGVQYL